MTTRHFTLDAAEAWVAALFVRHGASEVAAASVARSLVGAEARGLEAHGLSRIAGYLAMMKSGKLDGRAVPRGNRTAPTVLSIDAADGFAYPAIDLAIARLPPLARTQGFACAAVLRSNHAGALGLHAERLARTGLVALVVANTPAAIAPWGGTRPVYGSNPIAFAAPRANGAPPIVVDLALSKVARGRLLAARSNGGTVPDGVALDADGNPTTDVEAALAGSMLPIGDAKGAALALMVELLVAALAGATPAVAATSFFDGKGAPPGTGQLIAAFDPEAFGHERFADLVETIVGAVTVQAGARLPGARRGERLADVERNGLTVARALIDDLEAL